LPGFVTRPVLEPWFSEKNRLPATPLLEPDRYDQTTESTRDVTFSDISVADNLRKVKGWKIKPAPDELEQAETLLRKGPRFSHGSGSRNPRTFRNCRSIRSNWKCRTKSSANLRLSGPGAVTIFEFAPVSLLPRPRGELQCNLQGKLQAWTVPN
jgi:hypothetical protein